MHVPFTMKQYALVAARSARMLVQDRGITHVRLDVLLIVIDGPYLQRDLSLAFCVCPSVMCRLLQALEKDGFVKRTKMPGDRRQRIVEITDQGRALVRGIHRDGDLAPGAGRTCQHACEGHVRFAWCTQFERAGVGYGPLTDSDASELVFELMPTIRRIPPHHYFDYDIETIRSSPMEAFELQHLLEQMRSREARATADNPRRTG